ncbi:circadian locomoter output cycles protein kaput-like isoform X2 [Planococcus citri]|uniref:circadian locomoter output cycles protein kaput-like isoform X2 n=1 Tax=Planococcus citri TaxID=170843 RepID=UPI0031F80163
MTKTTKWTKRNGELMKLSIFMKSRNLSEKKRRDQFNTLISELNSIISVNGRKVDKSTILKAAMNTLKVYSENVARSLEYEISEEWKPSFLTNEEYTYLMLETLGGFILVFSSCGKILYASSSLATGLGYMLDEILNLSIYDLVTENDRSHLENMFFISTVNSLCMQNEDHPINFKCHFLRKSSKSGDLVYEPVEFLGKIKPQEIQNFSVDQDKILEFNKPSIFVGFIRLLTPQLCNDVILHDHLKTEFISHHNFEWKFLFLDERAPSIIGYSPFEVLGTSGYDYYHIDDLDGIISHHKTLMVQDEGVSGFYRFLTKGHQWVWLQTSSYITRRQWNSRIEFIVCTHRVINPLNADRNSEDNETKMLNCSTQDYTPSFSSNGSTSCSTKTSPPSCSWQSTTSTTSDSNYCEEEDKDERPLLRKHDDVLSYNNRIASGASSRNLYYHRRKSTRKFHHLDKNYSEYPGNSSDTSSSNSNGYYATTSTAQIVSSVTPKIKFEQECKVENVDTNASLEVCLQQKCDELQQIIAERQEELRIVSEQLFLARCNSSRQENANSSDNVISPGPQFSEHIPMEHSSSDGSLTAYSYENRPL